jgi:hypothetical protein
MSFVMKAIGKLALRLVRELHGRMEDDFGELAAPVPVEAHGSLRCIRIPRHDHPVDHGHMEVGQHVALREGREQELLRVVAVAVPPEGGVGGSGKDREAGECHLMLTPIISVARRPGSPVSGPGDGDGVVVLVE